MDQITTALVSAITSNFNTLADEAGKAVYQAVRTALQNKLGSAQAIDALEANPDSRQDRQRLEQALASSNVQADPALSELARQLRAAIEEIEARRKAAGKYDIRASGGQVGVIGERVIVEGGIHFHNRENEKQPSKPKLETLYAKMCNRDQQDNEFLKFFKEKYPKRPKRPHIYMIHGNARESHESLVERLRQIHVRSHINRPLQQHNVPFVVDGDLDYRKERLFIELARSITNSTATVPQNVAELCNLPHVRDGKDAAIMLIHKVEAAKWNRHYARFIHWYVNEFWAEIDYRDDFPQFLVFLLVVYPCAEKRSPIGRFLCKADRMKQAIEKSLNEIIGDIEHCHTLLMPELREVNRSEVDNWFFAYFPLAEKERQDHIEAIFGKKKQTCCMASVEAVLNKIINEHKSV